MAAIGVEDITACCGTIIGCGAGAGDCITGIMDASGIVCITGIMDCDAGIATSVDGEKGTETIVCMGCVGITIGLLELATMGIP